MVFKLVCGCPDYQKRIAKNPNSPYLAENIGRDWTGSNAGIDPEQLCKHGWAVVLAEKLLDEVRIPDDPAIPKVRVRKTKPVILGLQSDVTKGDYFGI